MQKLLHFWQKIKYSYTQSKHVPLPLTSIFSFKHIFTKLGRIGLLFFFWANKISYFYILFFMTVRKIIKVSVDKIEENHIQLTLMLNFNSSLILICIWGEIILSFVPFAFFIVLNFSTSKLLLLQFLFIWNFAHRYPTFL